MYLLAWLTCLYVFNGFFLFFKYGISTFKDVGQLNNSVT